MPGLFTDAFDAVATVLSGEATGTLTRAKNPISLAGVLCQGFDNTIETDEYGRVIAAAAGVRYKLAQEPTKKVEQGDIVKVKLDSDPSTTFEVRVAGRKQAGGVVRLMVQAVFE